MADTTINIKVSADTSEAAAKMKQLHKVASTPNAQAVKQQAVIAKGNTKAQQVAKTAARTHTTQNKQLQAQNKLIAQQNKLLQQNVRLQQQQTAQPSKMRRFLIGAGVLNKNGSPWSNGGGPGGGGPGGGPGGRNGRRQPGRGGGGNFGMWMLGGAAGILSYAVGALVNMVTSQIAPSDEAFTNFAKASRPLRPFGSAENIRSIAGRGRQFGFTELEGVQQMRGVARATGSIGDLTTAQAMARAMGMDVSEVSEQMGMLTRAGEGGKGARGERALSRLMSTAVASGLDKSRAGEHLSAVAGLVEIAGGRTAGAVDATGISGLLSFFSKSGQSGLQGSRGANVLRQIDEVVSSSGFGASGDPVQALIMRAMGFGTGGNASFADARASAQRGIFGQDGAKNLRAVFGQFDTEYGTGRAGDIAIGEAFRLSDDVVRQVREVIRAGGPNMDAEIARLTSKERPVQDQILSVLDEQISRRLGVIADTETQQITQGSQIAGSLDSIRTDINSMVSRFWPMLIDIMRLVADSVSLIADFIKTSFRGTFAETTATRKLTERQSELDKVLATGTPAEKFNEYQDYLFDLDRIREELRESRVNPGWGTALADSLAPDSGERDRRVLELMDDIDRRRSGAVQSRDDLRDPEYTARRDATRELLGIGSTTAPLQVTVTVPRDATGDPAAHRAVPRTAVPAHTTER